MHPSVTIPDNPVVIFSAGSACTSLTSMWRTADMIKGFVSNVCSSIPSRQPIAHSYSYSTHFVEHYISRRSRVYCDHGVSHDQPSKPPQIQIETIRSIPLRFDIIDRFTDRPRRSPCPRSSTPPGRTLHPKALPSALRCSSPRHLSSCRGPFRQTGALPL
jgi:hypothetical protein